MGIAAAEAAIALGIIILIFRKYRHIEGGDLKEMKD
jgi:NADH:ubiquinone oxidoreductase subunit K